VLLCSHLLGDVEDLCDRVAIMYGGRVRAEGTCDELLEQEHATLLETAELPEPVIAEVRELLRRHDLALTNVQRPRRTLESLFLEIVEQARAEGVQTSGARSGGAVPEFLGRGSDSQPAVLAADAAAGGTAAVDTGLLDSLVTPSARERTTP
jgi:ABC-2 type transport system ATP-binding protein